MNKIAEIMIGTIRAQVCGSEYKIDKDITQEELKQLYVLSKSQDMAHIVGAELEKQGILKSGDEVSEKFRKQQMIAIFRYERINYELEEICRVLEEAQIPHMPLKGSVIRKYYPEPWMRTSADIDLLVQPERLEDAKVVISSELKYECGEKHEHDVSMFSESGVHLELHFSTVEEYCAVNAIDIMQNIWDYAFVRNGSKYCYDIAGELFYFYHVAHMSKHFEYGGCGLRFFLDMWLLRRYSSFDEEKADELLKKGGLKVFADACAHLCEVWFGEAEHSEQTKEIEQYVLDNGIYGSKENNVAWQQITKGGKNKYALRLIFLSYDNMVKKYPSLEKHKWLFPFYQIRRWCSVIRNGRTKKSIGMLKQNSDVAQSRRGEVEKLLRGLALIK